MEQQDKQARDGDRGEQDELQEALALLEQSVRRRQRPSRFHARAILLALGQRLLGGQAVPEHLVLRLDAVLGPQGRVPWAEAVHEELLLAATEHVRAVDPRYLSRRDYDFAYTVAARADLEARLRAAEELGLPAGEELLDRVVRADEILQPYLENRGQGTPG